MTVRQAVPYVALRLGRQEGSVSRRVRAMSNDDRSSLDELEAKLRKARAAREAAGPGPAGSAGTSSTTRQVGVAYRIFVELLAGVLVGAGLGWFLDRILGTRPWFLLGLLVLGIVAGFVNTIRTAQRMSAEMSAPDAAGGTASKPQVDKGEQ